MCYDFFIGIVFIGYQDRGFGSCDVVCQFDNGCYGWIVGNYCVFVVGNSFENGGDQFGIWWQWNEFFGVGVNGCSGYFWVDIDVVGYDWNCDVFVFIGIDQGLDIQ